MTEIGTADIYIMYDLPSKLISYSALASALVAIGKFSAVFLVHKRIRTSNCRLNGNSY